jgi:class 3 adenylate cyclase
MRAVERGDLRARCPVVGNDEIGAVAEGFNRMVGGLRERELIRETFGKYVTEEVRDEILSGRVDLEGQTREVTILSSDIRDFTPWVEAHDPREVCSLSLLHRRPPSGITAAWCCSTSATRSRRCSARR